MFVRRDLLSGKRNFLYGSLLLMFISLICVAFSMAGSDDFDIARRETVRFLQWRTTSGLGDVAIFRVT